MINFPARVIGVLLIVLSACSSHGDASDGGGIRATDAGPHDSGFADAGAQDAGPQCSYAVQYGQDFPCNTDTDCTTGRCYFPLDLVNAQPVSGYCTIGCTPPSTSCPTGTTCGSANDRSGDVCQFAGTAVTLPDNHTLPFGSPCTQDADCKGTNATCGYVDNMDGTLYTYCTNVCTSPTDTSCGECASCIPEPGVSGSYQCAPTGNGAIGDSCHERSDCQTFDCQGFCTQTCSSGGVVTPCPTGTQCEAIFTNGEEFGLCIVASQKGGTPTNGECTFDFECATGDTCHIPSGSTSGTCQAASGLGMACMLDSDCSSSLKCLYVSPGPGLPPASENTVCTQPCSTSSDCGSAGTCVAVDLDTDLQLLDSSGTQVAENDDINVPFGIRFSQIKQTLGPGTYYVAVKAYWEAEAKYVLEISDGVNAEGMTAQTAGNTSQTQAQAITPPVKVSGAFATTTDTDFYSFTLTAQTTLTITTERGAPSVCMPSSAVGNAQFGQLCTTDFQCSSSECNQAFQTCGQPCTQNTDCGGTDPVDAGPGDGGPIIVTDGAVGPPIDAGPPQPICANVSTSFQTRNSCIAPGAYGELPAGSDCHYSFECSNGYCADYNGSVFCTETCAGDGGNCGIVTSGGMNSNVCAQMTVSPGGLSESDWACVP